MRVRVVKGVATTLGSSCVERIKPETKCSEKLKQNT
jgi:hypothetical protein